MLLENALSEELPSPTHSVDPSRPPSPPPPPPPPSPPPSAQPTANERDKMLAACIGAVVTSLTMTPFDVIKTRLQTQPSPPSPAVAVARFTPSTTPFPPPVASTSAAPPPPCCDARKATARRAPPPPPPPAHGGAGVWCALESHVAAARHVPGRDLAYAGAGSGTATLTFPTTSGGHVSCLYPSSSSSHALPPSPTLHARAQQPPRHLTGFVDAVTHIVRTEGLTALWRGTAPALAMSVPGQVVYMVGYDSLRRTALDRAPAFAYAREGAKGTREGLRRGYVGAVPLVAGALSRTLVATLLSPLELLRTRLQSHTPTSPLSLSRVIADLRWSNAWKGLGPTLWRDVPFSGVYWAGYEVIKRGLTGGRGMGEVQTARGRERRGSEFVVSFVSGAGSGVIAATLTNPFDVLKTRRQSSLLLLSPSSPSSASSRSTLGLLRTLIHTEGPRAMFAGLAPRLAKVGPACGVMIGVYEVVGGWRVGGA